MKTAFLDRLLIRSDKIRVEPSGQRLAMSRGASDGRCAIGSIAMLDRVHSRRLSSRTPWPARSAARASATRRRNSGWCSSR